LKNENKVGLQDVHKANVIGLDMIGEDRVQSVCGRGLVALWDASVNAVQSLVNVTQLKLDGAKINMIQCSGSLIAAYLGSLREIRVFERETG
jgi:hypothetical protein